MSSSEGEGSGEETWSDYDGSQAAEEEQARGGAPLRAMSRALAGFPPPGSTA